MLQGKYMRIEMGEPVLASLCDPQMPQKVLNIPYHYVLENG